MKKKIKILSVVGARPNYMKVAPIITEINKHNESILNDRKLNKNSPFNIPIEHFLVHTGQHYDTNMSDVFFKDLNLPKPDIYLNVGSASHAVQTAEIMKGFERVVLEIKPDLVITVGDVNSTVACSLVASKISYPIEEENTCHRPKIAHVEAGLRSFDRTMPEEINRILTDTISDLLFVTEENGVKNLKSEGIEDEKIFFVGNTMIDTLFSFKEKAKNSNVLKKYGLINRPKNSEEFDITKSVILFALLTLHRPSNVDDKEVFYKIMEALKEISQKLPIIFPLHPRTCKSIYKFGFESYFNFLDNNEFVLDGINVVESLSYLDFLCLMMNSKIVLTDSGGIQEETTCLRIPCVTIRNNTERPVTIDCGTNILAGNSKDKIVKSFSSQIKRKIYDGYPKYWDGNTAKRIINVILKSKTNQ